MVGVSGCFGSQPENETIDNVAEVSATVDEIVGTQPTGTEVQPAQDVAAALLLGQYARRLRLLTWAVAAIAVVLIVREVND